MATSNFYHAGNHGLYAIKTEDDEFAVPDTINNIVMDLDKYSVDNIKMDTPRAFDTGESFAVFNANAKVVAILEVCAGYYSDANINVYTCDALLDSYEREEITCNKRDIKKVLTVVKRYTTELLVTAHFSNGETMYEPKKS